MNVGDSKISTVATLLDKNRRKEGNIPFSAMDALLFARATK